MGGCLAARPLVNYLGRLPTLLLSFSLALLATVNLVGLHTVFSWRIYAYYAGLGLAIRMAKAALYIYLPELIPFKTRGRKVGICLNIGRFANSFLVLFAGYFIPLMGGYSNGVIFFGMSYLIGSSFKILRVNSEHG